MLTGVGFIFKPVLKVFCILLVRILQKKYKSVTIKNRNNHTNRNINKLILIQSVLYYFKGEFRAWGYFHPDCIWTDKDERFFRWLFPDRNFEEWDLVVWYKPEAVTYYHNKIFTLTKGKTPLYHQEIKKQLVKWGDWN